MGQIGLMGDRLHKSYLLAVPGPRIVTQTHPYAQTENKHSRSGATATLGLACRGTGIRHFTGYGNDDSGR